ncbi:sensor domain-containing diguanylate cyclase [Shewanella sp. Scap07]|uniref:sensor domain-containing diguanylate cyclase n=1 Tax=Shewanella sp. Scap07 TaxID=2589987 RepID=UPI0015C14F33|nr:sensor domain-containing diguanylate cyclase [Shewanella sp. Scap07]QLE84720.1 sensor domain-containing diguanylate cyclase [Shewanella sp. Scap07]
MDDISKFLDFLADAIVIVNRQSQVEFANRSCERLFGYGQGEMLGLSITDLMTPEKVQGHQNKVATFIDNQSHSRPMMSRNIMPCINAKGEGFNARISISNIEFHGQACGIATIQDYSTVQELINELRSEASTDPLTGLFNKRHLENVMSKPYLGIYDSGCLGVAYIDLNGFKLINDNLGHDVGDSLLVALSERLLVQSRSDDVCFRLGGDEFLVLFKINHHQHYQQEANGIGRKLHQLLTQEVQIEDQQQPIRVGASIGIGIVPHDDKDLARVIALADNAMYLSKTERQPYVLVEALCNHET